MNIFLTRISSGWFNSCVGNSSFNRRILCLYHRTLFDLLNHSTNWFSCFNHSTVRSSSFNSSVRNSLTFRSCIWGSFFGCHCGIPMNICSVNSHILIFKVPHNLSWIIFTNFTINRFVVRTNLFILTWYILRTNYSLRRYSSSSIVIRCVNYFSRILLLFSSHIKFTDILSSVFWFQCRYGSVFLRRVRFVGLILVIDMTLLSLRLCINNLRSGLNILLIVIKLVVIISRSFVRIIFSNRLSWVSMDLCLMRLVGKIIILLGIWLNIIFLRHLLLRNVIVISLLLGKFLIIIVLTLIVQILVAVLLIVTKITIMLTLIVSVIVRRKAALDFCSLLLIKETIVLRVVKLLILILILIITCLLIVLVVKEIIMRLGISHKIIIVIEIIFTWIVVIIESLIGINT